MKIKIGNTIYDGNKEPIMLILNKQDKENISRMTPEATLFCEYPTDKYTPGQIEKWTEVEEVLERFILS